jgi:hypothetical protein
MRRPAEGETSAAPGADGHLVDGQGLEGLGAGDGTGAGGGGVHVALPFDQRALRIKKHTGYGGREMRIELSLIEN